MATTMDSLDKRLKAVERKASGADAFKVILLKEGDDREAIMTDALERYGSGRFAIISFKDRVLL